MSVYDSLQIQVAFGIAIWWHCGATARIRSDCGTMQSQITGEENYKDIWLHIHKYTVHYVSQYAVEAAMLTLELCLLPSEAGRMAAHKCFFSTWCSHLVVVMK